MLTSQPTVVCLCGSTRFHEAFNLAAMHETLMGKIVITLGVWGHADHPQGARFLTSDGDESTKEKQALDGLHYRKIDLANEILVINVGGYIGDSTKREINYAREHGKRIRYMFPPEPSPEANMRTELQTAVHRADQWFKAHPEPKQTIRWKCDPAMADTLRKHAPPQQIIDAAGAGLPIQHRPPQVITDGPCHWVGPGPGPGETWHLTGPLADTLPANYTLRKALVGSSTHRYELLNTNAPTWATLQDAIVGAGEWLRQRYWALPVTHGRDGDPLKR